MSADFTKQNIELEIALPEGSNIVVKIGDKLSKGGEIASTDKQSQEINLASTLGISPKKVGKSLLVSIGSSLTAGQVVAQSKGFLKKKIFHSPVDGVLESLSEKGVIKIRKEETVKKVAAPTDGVVKKIEEGKISFEVPIIACVGDWAVGCGGWGNLKMASTKDENDLGDLDLDSEGKVLVFQGRVSEALVYKAEAIGAVGLVVGSVDKSIKCEEIAVLSFGSEDKKVAPALWEALSKFEGKPSRIMPDKNTLIIGN